MPQPPGNQPQREADPNVEFSWPGPRRRPPKGILDARLAARAEREAAAREAAEREAAERAAAERAAAERAAAERAAHERQAAERERRAEAAARSAETARPRPRAAPRPQPTVRAQPAKRRPTSLTASVAQPSPSVRVAGPPPRPVEPPRERTAQPPATTASAAATSARERWIITELRRQALTTDAALRDMSDRVDEMAHTLRRIVDYLPTLAPREPGSSTSVLAADTAVNRRLDELEARIEARLDEIQGAVLARTGPAGPSTAGTAGAAAAPGAGAAADPAAVRAGLREELTTITKQLGELGQYLRAELVTATGQAEARLNRDRDQMREALKETMTRLDELLGGTVSRDDLRQYWVEMAAKLAKQNEVVLAERQQLRADIAERFDEIASGREELRQEVGERLARVAEATAVRARESASDSAPLAAGQAAQKAAIDELRRELHQLGAQLLAATNPRNRPAEAPSALDQQTVETIKNSMAQAATALASAASKNDVEALRNQLAGTVTRLERSLLARIDADQKRWDEQLGAALEAVNLALEGAELNQRALLAEVSAAVRAAIGGVLPRPQGRFG